MAKLIYNLKTFKITQEGYDANVTAKTESIFAQGNGYIGIRAVDEEISNNNKEDMFVNGIFNRADDKMVTELANTADLIQTKIIIDERVVHFKKEDAYHKTINLKTGLLERIAVKDFGNKVFEFTFKRIVSLKHKHCYAQQITIKQLKGTPSQLNILPGINGQTTNKGAQHFKEGQKKLVGTKILQYFEETNQTRHHLTHTMLVEPKLDDEKLLPGDDFVIKVDRRKIYFDIKTEISVGQTFVLNKYMNLYTSIDLDYNSHDQQLSGVNGVKRMARKGFDLVVDNSAKEWIKKVWNEFKVSIEPANASGEYDLLALSFAIYHMTGFVPTHDSRLGIGSKGMSGEGYQGHSYWDTEFFITPVFGFVRPEVARNLLEYRYKGLAGAKSKAREFNSKGAAYPWETAWPDDGEVTPYWGGVDIKTGKQIPIASRMQEQHVPADIAFATEQYYRMSNDISFMEEMGYEMIIETGMFWATRAEWNMIKNRYEYNNVMGPNEYKGNINNNAYTNYMARRNMKLALKYLNLLKNKKKFLKSVDGISINRMKQMLKKAISELYIPKPDFEGIIPENDQFRKLSINDLTKFQFRLDAGKKLFHTKLGLKNLEGQIVKQADVVLLTYILPELFSKDVIRANYDYYEPKTTHDSSLSATTYAIQAIELDKMDEAYKMYKYSLNIDMGPKMDSSNAGIHAGSLGAIWQSTVSGFGGLRFFDEKLHVNPKLPLAWNKLEYGIYYHKQYLFFSINRKEKRMIITKKGHENVDIFYQDKKITLKNKITEVKL